MKIIKYITTIILVVIAVVITSIISLVVPKEKFEPYHLVLDSVWQKEVGNQEYLIDLNPNSVPEILLHHNINQSGHCIEIHHGNNILVNYIFRENEVCISRVFQFADVTRDQWPDIIFISVKDSTAYLNILEYNKKKQIFISTEKIPVDTVHYYHELPDITNNCIVTNKSGIYFDLTSGYTIQPRNVYKYNLTDKSISKTKINSIVSPKLKYIGFKQEEFLLAAEVKATGNTISPEEAESLKRSTNRDTLTMYKSVKHLEYQYGDFASYILLYNSNLDFAFNPIKFFGWTNFTKSEIVNIDSVPNIVTIANTIKGDKTKNAIYMCNLQGVITKHIHMPADFTDIFTDNEQFVFFGNKSIHIYSKNLKPMYEIPGISFAAGFFDLDRDTENEFIAFKNNELVVYSGNFNAKATFKIEPEFAPYPEENQIKILNKGGENYLFFNSRLFYYLFRYSQNNYAFLKYPFYLFVFSFWLGLLHLVLKVNSNRLENEKRHLEEIVSERTADLVVKNDELVLKNEEIQTQAEEIASQYDRLEKLDQFKETLTHALVHDLKNPLSQVLVNTSNENVRTAAGKMLRLIMNMLDVEKYEKAGFILNSDIHSLRNIITEVINGQEAGLKEKNLEVHLQFTDFKIMADKEVMIRVFDNLLSNAIRYSPLNQRIDIKAEPPGDGMLHISMKNYGDPISEEALPLIFDKYRHFGKTEIGAHRSTGLGLTFCKMAIEAHGGKIGAYNNPDEGCSFWFTMQAVSQNVKQEEIETILPDLKPKLILTQAEKEDLKQVANKMKEFKIFEISRFHEVLDPLKVTAGSNVNEWISMLFRAINVQNTEEYNRLINLVENGETKNTDC